MLYSRRICFAKGERRDAEAPRKSVEEDDDMFFSSSRRLFSAARRLGARSDK
jgi:hypothetical protein